MISIAMATYNGAKYIKEQIDSILNQTIQDFELVVCDDCSADNTFKILQEYAQIDSRFHVYLNKNNLGFKKNFEKAISLCKGEYIALSDQDDIWMDNHLELLLKAIKGKQMACGNSIFIDQHGKPLGMTLKYQEALDYIPKDDLKKSMAIFLFRNPYQGASMMITKELKDIALPFPEEPYHDVWLASLACFTGGFNYVDKPLLKYRRLESSVSGIRDQRKSKIEWFTHWHILNDRKHIISYILQNKKLHLNPKQCSFLKKMLRICERDHNRIGFRINQIYKLIHYKTIYNCDWKHWI